MKRPALVAARELVPLLKAQATDCERVGRLTDAVVDALKQANMFGLMAPVAVGGFEASAAEAMDVLELLAAADASAGWVTMAVGLSTGFAGAFMPDEGARTVFGSSMPLVAGMTAPRGKAEIVDGGLLLSGQWGYGSGIVHADWVLSGAMVLEGGKPRMLPGTKVPETLVLMVPQAQARLIGEWDVLGLRATASLDYAIASAVVEDGMAFSPLATDPLRGGGFYRIGFHGMTALGHGAVVLGIARRALDELRSLATSAAGVPSGLSGAGADFREKYAAAEAQLRSARAFCREVWTSVDGLMERGEPVATRDFTLMRLAMNHAHRAAAEVCTFAYLSAGGTALRSGILQRCFRDMMSAAQHIVAAPALLGECGRELLSTTELKWSGRTLTDA